MLVKSVWLSHSWGFLVKLLIIFLAVLFAPKLFVYQKAVEHQEMLIQETL
ncbi:hypothetical protein HN446_01800 [bacterium]|jgi:hypothetical protein|nr:hypothetical protein [bacterium]